MLPFFFTEGLMAKTKTETGLSTRSKDELAKFDYGDDAGGGLHDRTQDDIKIPFLSLLQSLSPQITGQGREKLPGAEVGQLCNSVTDKLYGEEVLFVPAIRERLWVEWKPRDQGGGFIARHDPNSQMIKQVIATQTFPNYTSEAGNNLVKTMYLWGIEVDAESGNTFPMIIAFDKSKLKVYTSWRTTIDLITVLEEKIKPPMWAHYLRITSKQEVNKAGQPYQNFVLTPAIDGDIHKSLLGRDDPRYLEAKKVEALVTDGKLDADENSHVSGGDSDPDSPF